MFFDYVQRIYIGKHMHKESKFLIQTVIISVLLHVELLTLRTFRGVCVGRCVLPLLIKVVVSTLDYKVHLPYL